MAEISPSESHRRAPCKRLWIGSALLLLPILAVLGYFLLREFTVPRRAVDYEPRCERKMRNLGHALWSYAATHRGLLPPAFATDSDGNRLYSWRVLLTPYLDHQAFYEAYDLDQPWDHPENFKRANGIYYFYTCPVSRTSNQRRRSELVSERPTDYVAVVGSGTAFPGKERVSMDLISLRDGLENTIMLVEIANSNIHWSEPRDLEFEEMSFKVNDRTKPSISSPHEDGPGVVFADGSFARLSPSIPPEVVKGLLTVDGGEEISRSELEELGWVNYR